MKKGNVVVMANEEYVNTSVNMTFVKTKSGWEKED